MPRDRHSERAGRCIATAALVLGALLPCAASAQAPVLLEGLLDLEGWSTGRGSVLTARNDGRAAALARLALWSAVEPWHGFVVHAQIEVAGGAASGEEHVEVEMEQAGMRRDSRPDDR
jgi:hypothetical protein